MLDVIVTDNWRNLDFDSDDPLIPVFNDDIDFALATTGAKVGNFGTYDLCGDTARQYRQRFKELRE